MRYLLVILLFASCTTLRKATAYMDGHPKESAEYYKDKYPIRDSIVTITIHDTIQKEATIRSLDGFRDSLLGIAEDRNKGIQQAQEQLSAMQRERDYTDGAVEKLQGQLKSIKPFDTASYRKLIEIELQKKIPVSAITTNDHYQENTAKLAYYTIIESDLNKLKEDKKRVGKTFGWLMAALIRTVWFWLVVIAFCGWIYWRIRAGALNSIISKIKP